MLTPANVLDLARRVFDLAIQIEGIPATSVQAVLVSVLMHVIQIQAVSLTPLEVAGLHQMILGTLPTLVAGWMELETVAQSWWSQATSCCGRC